MSLFDIKIFDDSDPRTQTRLDILCCFGVDRLLATDEQQLVGCDQYSSVQYDQCNHGATANSISGRSSTSLLSPAPVYRSEEWSRRLYGECSVHATGRDCHECHLTHPTMDTGGKKKTIFS